jgi:RNA polymerase sigma-70 factor (ECF subfamily)
MDASPPPPDDLALLREGGADALAVCFARYRDRLTAMVAYRLGAGLQGRFDPADVLQEAYLDAAGRLADYLANPTLPPFLWLRFLTGQRLDRLFRTHLGAERRAADREVPLPAGVMDDHTPPLAGAARAEVQTLVLAALARLSADDRAILVLRHFEQLTTAEAAAELAVSQAAAGKRYLRALLRLKDVLGHPEGLT